MPVGATDFRYRLKRGVLRVAKSIGLFHLTRLRARRKLLILCYHGFELDDEAAFRPRLFMQPSVFRRRLALIRRARSPVLGLDEATRRLKDKTLPANAVCLTIDDGFFSTLACAAPAIYAYRFRATLYATTYYVDKAAPVFNLMVQYLFWKTTAAVLDTTDQPWGLAEVVDLSSAEDKNRAIWQIIATGSAEFDEPGRQHIGAVLGERLGVSYPRLAGSRRLGFLTPRELAQLRDYGIDVQLHTHRHNFPAEDKAVARAEIIDNADFLHAVLARRPTHFCYPSGKWSQQQQWPWLASLGIETASTCNPGLNTPSTPPLGLYRVVDANDLTEIEFEAELYGFSETLRQLLGRRRQGDIRRRPAPAVRHAPPDDAVESGYPSEI